MTDRIGLPFLFGLYGVEPRPDTVRLLRETGACGVLLHRRNVETGEQVRALADALRDAVGHPILVAVRHEGGVVTPFTRDITPFPGHLALGNTETPSLASEVGRCMARELVPLGIDLNLAPHLGLSAEAPSGQEMLRSFGDDVDRVAEMGAAMIRGMREGGLEPVPTGLSMSALPLLHAAAQEGAEMVMVSPSTEGEVGGARTRGGFQGLLLTEDLSEDRRVEEGPIEMAVLRALQGGYDAFLVSHHADLMKRAFDAYREALDLGRVDETQVEISRARVRKLLRTREERSSGGGTDEEMDSTALAQVVAAAAVRVERDPNRWLPLSPDHPVGILVPRFSEIAGRVALDDDLRGAAFLMQQWARDISAKATVLEAPVVSPGSGFSMVVDWAASHPRLVLFLLDAESFPAQKRLLEEVQRRCSAVVVVPLGNPADARLVAPGNAVVQVYGYRVPQLAAAADVIFRGT